MSYVKNSEIMLLPGRKSQDGFQLQPCTPTACSLSHSHRPVCRHTPHVPMRAAHTQGDRHLCILCERSLLLSISLDLHCSSLLACRPHLILNCSCSSQEYTPHFSLPGHCLIDLLPSIMPWLNGYHKFLALLATAPGSCSTLHAIIPIFF